MLKIITESEEINRVIYNVNVCLKDSKHICDFLLDEYLELIKSKIGDHEIDYYNDMFTIIYKSICKKNKVISYITLSYAIILIIISIKFAIESKTLTNKDKDSYYSIQKNKLFIYPDCLLGIKIIDNDRCLLIDYKGKFTFTKVGDTAKLQSDYGKFLTRQNFKVFKFDESKFQYISNIHLEKFENLLENIKYIIPLKKAPYLIISGNLTTFECINRIDLFFDYYSQYYEKIIYILGNFEFHGSNLGLDKTVMFYREYIKRYNWKKHGASMHNKKILFLEQELTIFNNIHIIGLTLWANITKEVEDDYKEIKYKDIPITYEDVSNTHIKSVIWLSNTLKEINPNLPVLVISYNIPSYSLVGDLMIASQREGEGYEESPTFRYSEFASHLDNIIKKYNNIINWIIGHPYSVDNKIIFGTLALSNSYQSEHKNDSILCI